jgi:hypothetical protein
MVVVWFGCRWRVDGSDAGWRSVEGMRSVAAQVAMSLTLLRAAGLAAGQYAPPMAQQQCTGVETQGVRHRGVGQYRGCGTE